jgi:putative ABC transport system substrate-binding protein
VEPKRLELLRKLVPTASAIALLVNPTSPYADARYRKRCRRQPAPLGLGLRVLHASSERDFDAVFATMVQLRVAAAVIGNDRIFPQVGIYAGCILKGEKPADLPVQAPTKYERVITLKTVKSLGIELPPSVLARADEVIE